jgi:signal transduction histidine kinase
MHTLTRLRPYSTTAAELEVVTATHDLRNRLSIANCEIQLLRRCLGAALEAPEANCLDQVERSLTHTNTLLEELLELTCRRAHLQVTYDPPTLDLVDLARRQVDARRCTSGHQIELVVSDAQLTGAWDEARLNHLLDNLLTNALQYSTASDPVVVTVGQQTQEAVLSVADRGIGIPAADQSHVFEPFFRARNAEAVAPGLGLGLAVARLIVEQYGGTLEVESTEDFGSTFTARLPLASI